MKTGLIVLGVILLVFGGVLYFMPAQTAVAATTTIQSGSTDTKTSYASLFVPLQVTISLVIIGLVLFVLGLILPDPHSFTKQELPETHILKTREHIKTGNGNESDIVKERHEERLEKTVRA